MGRLKLTGLVGVLLAASAVSYGVTTADQPGKATAPSSVAGLTVAPDGTLDGYSRTQFGPAWADVDGNGCDTRNDVLSRDLTNITRSNGCTVMAGTLNDPYTGHTITYRRGRATSSAVQIDHVVSLGDAWRTGARAWTAEERLKFANDPNNLLAVDGPTNEAKGDDDAGEWLPPRQAEACDYTRRQVTVKTTYHLTVNPTEAATMKTALATC